MTRGPTELGEPNDGIRIRNEGQTIAEFDIEAGGHDWMEWSKSHAGTTVTLSYAFNRIPTDLHDNIHILAFRFKGIRDLEGTLHRCVEIAVDQEERFIKYFLVSDIDEG